MLGVQEMIAQAVMQGLKSCPDIVTMRKELLVATRHSLAIPTLRTYAICKPMPFPAVYSCEPHNKV